MYFFGKELTEDIIRLPYDRTISKQFISTTEIEQQTISGLYDNMEYDLKTVETVSEICQDKMYFQFKHYNRETTYDGNFDLVTKATVKRGDQMLTSFRSDYSGFIGFLPYTANESRKEHNFLWYLRK